MTVTFSGTGHLPPSPPTSPLASSTPLWVLALSSLAVLGLQAWRLFRGPRK